MKNKKKIGKRFAVALLVLAMALGLVACSGNGDLSGTPTDSDPIEETTTAGDNTELTPNYSGMTYNDTEFKLLMRSEDEFVREMAIDKVTTSTTELDKRIYYRNREVESQMGVSFLFITDTMEKVHAAVKQASLTETDAYDLVINHGRQIFHEAASGYHLDWNTLPTVNLDALWWSQNIKTAWTTPSGALYAANGDISYHSIGSANCMYFNKALVNASGATSPYTYVENDNWTFETFFQSARDVGATISGNGGLGYVSNIWRGPMDALYASGHSTIVIHEDKSFTVDVNNQRCINTIDAFIAFLKDPCVQQEEDVGKARQLFSDNKLVYFDDNIKVATTTYKDVNFGILPFPKYSTEVNNYQSLVGSGTNTFAILAKTSDGNRQRIGDVVECLAYIGYTDVVPFYFDTVVSAQAVKDPESLKSLSIIRSTLIFDLGHYLNPGEIGNIAVDVANGNYSSFSNALESIVKNGLIAADLADWLEK